MITKPGPREPESITSGHGGGPARQARTARPERLIVLGAELNALARLVGDRRIQRNLITGIIGLVALSRLLREGETRSFARLLAWDQKQSLRRQRIAGVHPARNTRLIHGR